MPNNKKYIFYQVYFYIIFILNKRIPEIDNIFNDNDYKKLVSLCIDNNNLEFLLKPNNINDFFNNIIYDNNFNNKFFKWFNNQIKQINNNINNNIEYKNDNNIQYKNNNIEYKNDNNIEYKNDNINNNIEYTNDKNDNNTNKTNININYDNKLDIEINNKDILLLNKSIKRIQLSDIIFEDNNYNININNKLILNNKTYTIPEGLYNLEEILNWLKNNVLEYEFIINNNKLTIISKNNDKFDILNDINTSVLYLFGFINPKYENQIDYTGENNININKHYIITLIINDDIYNIFNIDNIPFTINKLYENNINISTLQIILKQNDYQESNVKKLKFKLLIK